MQSTLLLISLLLVLLSTTLSFVRHTQKALHLSAKRQLSLQLSDESSGNEVVKPKGFGKTVVIPEEPKDIGTEVYEKQAKKGIPEYNIFLRPTKGGNEEWIPVGSMTIPRDIPVAKAVYEVENELLKGTFKLYPKLKSYSDGKKDATEPIFEYGYCLKAFPDEEIKVLKKIEETENQNFFSRWLGSITNPIDTSALTNKGGISIEKP